MKKIGILALCLVILLSGCAMSQVAGGIIRNMVEEPSPAEWENKEWENAGSSDILDTETNTVVSLGINREEAEYLKKIYGEPLIEPDAYLWFEIGLAILFEEDEAVMLAIYDSRWTNELGVNVGNDIKKVEKIMGEPDSSFNEEEGAEVFIYPMNRQGLFLVAEVIDGEVAMWWLSQE